MKKTILVGLIAIAMLFAFTACEQPSWPTNKSVNYISIEQVGDIVKGQAFDASDFEVVVHYTDSSTERLPGAGLVTGDFSSGNAKVEATLKVVNADVKAEAYAEFKTVTGITFDGAKATATGTTVTVEPETKDGTYKVTLAYDGGTLVLDASDITLTYETLSTAAAEGKTYPVVVTDYQLGGTGTQKISNLDITTNIEATLAKQLTIEDITRLEVTYNNTINYGASWTDPVVKAYAGDVEITVTKDKDYKISGNIPTGTVNSLDPIKFQVAFIGTGANAGKVAPVDCQVSVVDQFSETGLTFTYSGTVYQNEAATINAGLIKAPTVTWLGNPNNTAQPTFTIVVTDNTYVVFGTQAKTVNIKWTASNGQTGTGTVSITPQVKSN